MLRKCCCFAQDKGDDNSSDDGGANLDPYNCPRCYQPYSVALKKEPRFLQCGHSVCQGCLSTRRLPKGAKFATCVVCGCHSPKPWRRNFSLQAIVLQRDSQNQLEREIGQIALVSSARVSCSSRSYQLEAELEQKQGRQQRRSQRLSRQSSSGISFSSSSSSSISSSSHTCGSEFGDDNDGSVVDIDPRRKSLEDFLLSKNPSSFGSAPDHREYRHSMELQLQEEEEEERRRQEEEEAEHQRQQEELQQQEEEEEDQAGGGMYIALSLLEKAGLGAFIPALQKRQANNRSSRCSIDLISSFQLRPLSQLSPVFVSSDQTLTDAGMTPLQIRKLREVVTESVDGPTQLQQHSPTAPAIGLNRSSSTIVAIQASAFTPSAAPHRRLSLPTAQPPQRKEQGHQREQQQQRQNQLKPSPSFRRNSGSGGGGGGGQSQQKRRLPPQQLPQDI